MSNPQAPSANPFKVFTKSEYNLTLPALLKIYEFRVSSDKHNKDAKCRGCNLQFEKFKLDGVINHARLCKSVPKDELAELELEIKGRERKKTSQNPEQAATQTSIDRLLVNFISESGSSISIIENPDFRRILQLASPNYQLPTRFKLSNNLIPSTAIEIRQMSRSKLDQAPKFSITIEFDAWTSNAGNSLLAVVATIREGLSTLIDLVDISAESHSAEFLTTVANTSLRNSGIKLENINAIVSDEASNCKLARVLLVDELDCHVVEYRCMAHVFNLIGALMSKSEHIKPTLENLVKLVNYIGKNKVLVSHLREDGATKVVRAVPTRWYSTCSTINSILKMKPYLLRVPHENRFGYEKWGPIAEDPLFWNNLQNAKIYFDRIASMIGVAEASDSLLSDSFRGLLEYGRFLMIDLDRTTKFRDVAIVSFLTHFQKLNLELLVAAYFLNPNFGLEYLTPYAIEECK